MAASQLAPRKVESPPPLTADQKRAVRMYILGEDVQEGVVGSYANIARILGYEPRTVRRWFQRNRAMQAYVEEINSEAISLVKTTLVKGGVQAAKQLQNLSTTATKKTGPQVKATTEILDRIGVTTVKQVEVSGPAGGPQTHLVGIVTEAYNRRSRGVDQSEVIEAEVVESKS